MQIIIIKGSDDELSRFLAQNPELIAAGQSGQGGNGAPPQSETSTSNETWDDVARQFAKYVSEAAAGGRPGQKDAMVAWLRAGGSIPLTKLWSAAGVKTQHDYAGVGGSLTKNMVKANGPKAWYTWHRNGKNGEWVYEIVDYLREPLKRTFGV